jgi:hypothetical protein
MRFLLGLCRFFIWGGILSLLLVTADQILGLGIWHGAYPPVQTDEAGRQTASTYWECMAYIGGAILIGIVGQWLIFLYLKRRYGDVLAMLEEPDES